MKELTREELAHGRALLEAAFGGPWRYTEFEIECSTCEGGTTSVCDGKKFVECMNPECDGTHAPCTFVEAPEQYPGESEEYRAQVVATIDVPGLSCLAEKNGEAICWLRNNAEALIEAREQLNEFAAALAWLSTDLRHTELSIGLARESAPGAVQRMIDYAKSLGWTGGTK
jgi:hypothetical protein